MDNFKKSSKKHKGDEDMGAVIHEHPKRISVNTEEEYNKFIKIAEDQSEPSDYVKKVINRYRAGKYGEKTQ